MEELIIRSLQGRADAEELRRLRRWRKKSPTNEQVYQDMAETWRITAHYEDAVRSAPPSASQIVRHADRSQGAGASKRRRASRSTLLRFGGFAAAALAAVAFGYGVALWVFGSWSTGFEVETGSGEMTTVTLPDGTAARLAPRTKMRVPGEEGGTDQIEVWLDGRAFFGVDPTSERGFAVRTPHGEATALGTRFEVRSEERALEVLVVEGSVQLLAGDSRVELAESQLGTISGDAPPEITTVDHVAPRLDWMGASLVFRETPLERVLEEIEHRYDKEVVLEDDELGGRTVTATFTDQRLEEIAIVVCEIAALHCAMQGDVLRVTGLED